MLKTFPKILTIFFLTMFILQMIFLFFLLAAPVASQAADIKFTPQVGISGYNFNAADKTTGNIAHLVRAIYNYGIGIVGILAAIVLMFGGVLWIVAGGNSSQVTEAKEWIGAALTGLVLALTSYLILNTVNPALVNLTTSGIKSVAEFKGTTTGSCTTEICEDNYEEKACKDNGGTFAQGKTCPTPCCLHSYLAGYMGNGGGYQGCTAKIDQSKNDCDKLNGVIILSDGECKKAGAYYTCASKLTTETTTGSCITTGECFNNYTKEKCNEISGTFNENGKCYHPPCCAFNEVSGSSSSRYGTLYRTCIDYDSNLTENICYAKNGDNTTTPSYLPSGECKIYTDVFGTSGSTYNCISK